jgi:hypothetical protein
MEIVSKVCPKCKTERPIEDFCWRIKSEGNRQSRCKHCTRQESKKWYHNNKETAATDRKQYYKANKQLILERTKRWYAKNKRQYRDKSLQRRFGITIEQYDEMLTSQNNSCAICKTPPGDIALAVDHCHTTGKIRSLLCFDCNTLLGLCEDSITVLQSAMSYLRDHA